MWIIVTLCVSSSITARGNLEKPTVTSYYRLFEAVALHKTDPEFLESLWPGVQPTIWDDMQKTVH